jgi:hypothetical protein
VLGRLRHYPDPLVELRVENAEDKRNEEKCTVVGDRGKEREDRGWKENGMREKKGCPFFHSFYFT